MEHVYLRLWLYNNNMHDALEYVDMRVCVCVCVCVFVCVYAPQYW